MTSSFAAEKTYACTSWKRVLAGKVGVPLGMDGLFKDELYRPFIVTFDGKTLSITTALGKNAELRYKGKYNSSGVHVFHNEVGETIVPYLVMENRADEGFEIQEVSAMLASVYRTKCQQ